MLAAGPCKIIMSFEETAGGQAGVVVVSVTVCKLGTFQDAV